MAEDKYDWMLWKLRKIPDDKFQEYVLHVWDQHIFYPEGELFGVCSPNRKSLNLGGKRFGCLTQVKNGTSVTPDHKLTEKIRLDSRVPYHPCNITKDNLEVFAEYHRLMDQMWSRS